MSAYKKKPLRKCLDCPALIGGAKKRCGPCQADNVSRMRRESEKRRVAKRNAEKRERRARLVRASASPREIF